MWSLGHDDSDVSLYARAEGSLVTLEQIRGAKTRAQLNELYVMNGTMIVGRGTISYPIWYNFLSSVFCCILFCILLYSEKFRKYAVFCRILKV